MRAFPEVARRRAGFELWEVQKGNPPSDFKPMPAVGIGVHEIRIRVGAAYRVLYVAKFSEAVYVLHAFQKKTQKTARDDLAFAKKRFRDLVQERRRT